METVIDGNNVNLRIYLIKLIKPSNTTIVESQVTRYSIKLLLLSLFTYRFNLVILRTTKIVKNCKLNGIPLRADTPVLVFSS